MQSKVVNVGVRRVKWQDSYYATIGNPHLRLNDQNYKLD